MAALIIVQIPTNSENVIMYHPPLARFFWKSNPPTEANTPPAAFRRSKEATVLFNRTLLTKMDKTQ